MFGYYAILATKPDGKHFTCFTWRGLPEQGIERAKRDAKKFGVECSNFRAEFLGKELS